MRAEKYFEIMGKSAERLKNCLSKTMRKYPKPIGNFREIFFKKQVLSEISDLLTEKKGISINHVYFLIICS